MCNFILSVCLSLSIHLDCFVTECVENDYVNCTYQNTTEEYNNFQIACNNVSHCEGEAKLNNIDICKNCSDHYDAVNKIYDGIRLAKHDKFCFDIKDNVSLKS